MESFSLVIDGVSVQVAGPSLDAGPLPALFYFALSAEESLELDPFNQPVTHLSGCPLRIYSLTIPGHEPGRDKTKAIEYWAEEMGAGRDPFTPFLSDIRRALDGLIADGWINEKKVAAAGLSRGAFIATHLAAQEPRIRTICGFAPLTTLTYQSDFEGLATSDQLDIVNPFNLKESAEKLIDCTLRCYISNRDTRVNSDLCYEFIRTVTERQYAAKVRSPKVELIVYPAIGHKGHGTPPEIFQAGADWLSAQLCEETP